MGDDSSFRYRRDDGYAAQPTGSRSPQAQPDTQSAEDALAELARMIGENDPFADFADMAEEPAPAPAPARPAREAPGRPQFSALPVERRFDDWQPGRRSREEGDNAPATREPTVSRGAPTSPPAFPSRAPAAPTPRPPLPQAPSVAGRDAAFPPRESTAVGGLRGRAPEPRGWAGSEATQWGAAEAAGSAEQRSTVRQGYGSLARRADGSADQTRAPATRQDYDEEDDTVQPDRRDDSAYAYSDSEQTRYADYDDTYDPAFDDEGYMPPHSEEVYETEPRRNKGRIALIAVGALVGLGVVATAGVMMFGGGGSSSSSTAETAPVIKADTTPSKVAGPTPGNGQGADGQKLIYDRVGGQPGQERVVPREEQPMDVSAAAAAAAAAGAQQPTSPTDPKRVRTVAVRSDGSIAPNAAPPAAPAAPTGVAPTAYAPTQHPVPTGAPPPKTVAVVPTTGQGVPMAAPAAPPAPAAAQQAAAPAAPPPAASANGNYVVQVSSQKSEADALGSFKVLQTRYPQLLGSYKASVQRADLGDKGVFYRALVGPFGTRDEANNLCNALQAQGGTCFVTRR